MDKVNKEIEQLLKAKKQEKKNMKRQENQAPKNIKGKQNKWWNLEYSNKEVGKINLIANWQPDQ